VYGRRVQDSAVHCMDRRQAGSAKRVGCAGWLRTVVQGSKISEIFGQPATPHSQRL
jgi:hypothetical protein